MVKLPRCITPKLAYFIGYLQGDGSIESNKIRINFTDEDVKQIIKINTLCFELFDIKGKIRKRFAKKSKKAAYTISIGSLVLNSYLHHIFNINRGIKLNLKIPLVF